MPRRKTYHKKVEPAIGEEIRIAVNLSIKKFLYTEEQKELEFPSSLTSEERAYIHQLARDQGLRSKSRGKGSARYLTVYKREGSSIVQADATFHLTMPSRNNINSMLHKFPLTSKERQELLPLTERDRIGNSDAVKEVNKSLGRLCNGIPLVPALSANPELLLFRQKLPIWGLRDEIITAIGNHQVVVLSGETGSGKTTQVPQFIMEHCQATNKPCRIICTQPRRISAVSVSERVAAERSVKIGDTVGYQIRLESRISPSTLLTYCTDGVLLRTLMGGDSSLATITHIIVDEVHERNRFCDFLLIALRDSLTKIRSLRLILMSATMDTQVFTKYFNNCPVISVPGRQFDVKEYFLEDILKMTKYMNKPMLKLKKKLNRKSEQCEELEKWTRSVAGEEKHVQTNSHKVISSSQKGSDTEGGSDPTEMEGWLKEEMDRYISEAWLTGSTDAFTQLLHLILSENASIDYQHSETSVTALMVAAGRGDANVAEQLLNLGANLGVRASNGWTALDWARNMNQPTLVELVQAYINTEVVNCPDILLAAGDSSLRPEDQQLLEVYHDSFNDEHIDIDLLTVLISQLHAFPNKGAILVFLAGYDDIVDLKEHIATEDRKLSDIGKYTLYVLHSNMQLQDQKRVFRPSPNGTRKIILSTNIAETSITIDDVVFVIDAGKVKEKSYDAMSGVCMLRPTWISKACAQQRRGRAGRTQPGICYHLFSSVRHKAMQQYHTPEILRLPLQELCLHTKLLAPPNTTIADFLARAIEPPSFAITRNAVHLLKTIDALDPWEDLTDMGHHLLDLPIEPRLGKMLLYSVVLKCLDPILTIVCCLTYKDPFVLPSQPSLKRAAMLRRKTFASGACSDHMALLRSFQLWQHARWNGRERSFCEENFVSSPTMEIVMGMRSQLLGQLRASGFVRARGTLDVRDLNTNSESWAVVKAAITAGLYPNMARIDRENNQLRTQKEFRVMFHPSSCLRDCPQTAGSSMAAAHAANVDTLASDWLLYDEMSRSGRLCHARCCTVVSPITVAIFAGPGRMPLDAVTQADLLREGAPDADSDSEVEDRPEGQNTLLKLDDWIVFRVEAESAHLALQLRQKWHSLFLRRMRAPSKPWSQGDEAVLKSVVTVLSTEEAALGLHQPVGIGQRPRPMATEYSSPKRNTEEEEERLLFTDNRPRLQHKYDGTSNGYGGERSENGSLKSFGSKTPSPTPSLGSVGPSDGSGNSRYFIIKSCSPKNIDISLNRGLWCFAPSIERKIVRLFKEGKRVFLVFTVQGSGSFQGFARLVGDEPNTTVDNSELDGPVLMAPLPIEWIKRANIPFQATKLLSNSFNENRRVQTSRDGQELEPKIGETLCRMWDKIPAAIPSSVLPKNPPESLEQPGRGSYHGRPIRGYTYNGYNGYQQYNGSYTPRSKPSK